MKSYAELAASIAAIEKIGKWIALSKMFGSQMSESQGCVIASHLFITGEPLLEYQRRNGMVGSNPYVPYDAMGAAFQEAGGIIEVLEKSPNAARIKLTYKGIATPFSFTWEDAQKEPLVYDGKEGDIVAALAAGRTPKLKTKYATPRSRQVMLYARVLSDGIRTVAPHVNFGRYTPEEVDDFDGVAEPVAGENLSSPGVAAVAPSVSAPVAAGSSVAAASVAPSAPPAPGSAAYNALPMAQQADADQAAHHTATAAPAQPTEPAPLAVDPRSQINLDDPAQEHQKAAIIAEMQSLAQQGMTDIGAKVKAKLAVHHIEGILGLTVKEADLLLDALKTKQIDLWVASAIFGHKSKANIGFPAPS